MRQGKDGPTRREFLLAQLENFQTGRADCPPSQREEFDIRIRSCMAQLSQLHEAALQDASEEAMEVPVIPSFD